MEELKPRRRGTLAEYQSGRYFMYVTEWEEVSNGRKHREVEIYHNTSTVIWNSTDPNQFEKAKEIFFESPEAFEGTTKGGELPIS